MKGIRLCLGPGEILVRPLSPRVCWVVVVVVVVVSKSMVSCHHNRYFDYFVDF